MGDTKERILQTALDLFARRGYEAVSVSDIAGALGMTKDHHLSFLAAVSDGTVQLKKLYPEGEALARFRIDGVRRVYGYCNRHGLFEVKL